MSDLHALLRAVVDNPDDDTPRLVYADWLEEHAATDAERARAEFIRIQCEIEPLRTSDDPRLDALVVREGELWEAYKDVWDIDLSREFEVGSWTYARGFMERVGVYLHQVPRLAELFAAAPFRGLDVIGLVFEGSEAPDPGDVADYLASVPAAARLTALGVRENGFDEYDIGKLARSKHLAGLHELDLSENDYFEPEALFRGGRLTRLRSVYLAAIGLGDDWVTALTECPAARLRRLRDLDLSDNDLTDDAAVTLAGCPHLRLDRLYLAGNQIEEESVEALRERFGAGAVLLERRED